MNDSSKYCVTVFSLITGCIFLLFNTGCVTETRKGNAPFAHQPRNTSYMAEDIKWSPVVTSSSGRQEDKYSSTTANNIQQSPTQINQENKPYTESTTYTNAAIAPLGSLPWNGISIPLVCPMGDYIAVQSGAPVPWEILLGEVGAGVMPYSMITIYHIELQEETGRPLLIEKHWLENIGILGRMADKDGFLIESPRPDGNRWIGKVSWLTGEIDWLVRGLGVNAFGSLAPDGRLAWCWREINNPNYELIVQGNNEVYNLPADNGSWLMPVWSGDGNTLFTFRLAADETFGVVALDPSSQIRLSTPLSSRALIDNGIAADAYDALAAIPQPAAPDGSARLLFYHSGISFKRVCMFDPYREGIAFYKSLSGGGAWHTADSLILATDDSVYYQEMNSKKPPIKLMTGAYLPIPSTPPDRPYVMMAPASNRSDRVNLYLMQLIESDTVTRLQTGAVNQ